MLGDSTTVIWGMQTGNLDARGTGDAPEQASLAGVARTESKQCG